MGTRNCLVTSFLSVSFCIIYRKKKRIGVWNKLSLIFGWTITLRCIKGFISISWWVYIPNYIVISKSSPKIYTSYCNIWLLFCFDESSKDIFKRKSENQSPIRKHTKMLLRKKKAWGWCRFFGFGNKTFSCWMANAWYALTN